METYKISLQQQTQAVRISSTKAKNVELNVRSGLFLPWTIKSFMLFCLARNNSFLVYFNREWRRYTSEKGENLIQFPDAVYCASWCSWKDRMIKLNDLESLHCSIIVGCDAHGSERESTCVLNQCLSWRGKQSIYCRFLKWIELLGSHKKLCYTGINQLNVNINFYFFFLIALSIG